MDVNKSPTSNSDMAAGQIESLNQTERATRPSQFPVNSAAAPDDKAIEEQRSSSTITHPEPIDGESSLGSRRASTSASTQSYYRASHHPPSIKSIANLQPIPSQFVQPSPGGYIANPVSSHGYVAPPICIGERNPYNRLTSSRLTFPSHQAPSHISVLPSKYNTPLSTYQRNFPVEHNTLPSSCVSPYILPSDQEPFITSSTRGTIPGVPPIRRTTPCRYDQSRQDTNPSFYQGRSCGKTVPYRNRCVPMRNIPLEYQPDFEQQPNAKLLYSSDGVFRDGVSQTWVKKEPLRPKQFVEGDEVTSSHVHFGINSSNGVPLIDELPSYSDFSYQSKAVEEPYSQYPKTWTTSDLQNTYRGSYCPQDLPKHELPPVICTIAHPDGTETASPVAARIEYFTQVEHNRHRKLDTYYYTYPTMERDSGGSLKQCGPGNWGRIRPSWIPETEKWDDEHYEASQWKKERCQDFGVLCSAAARLIGKFVGTAYHNIKTQLSPSL